MKRLLVLAVAGLLVSVTAALTSVGAGADDQTPTVKAIMKKLHGKSATSHLGKVKAQLKKAEPNRTALAKEAKEYAILGAELGKNEPPKGEKESWTKLSEAFLKDAKELEEAVKEKDKAAAEAAVKKLSASCKDCHTAHKK
jgi:cytochrome c556